MSEQLTQQAVQTRKPYLKPQIEKIALRTTETMGLSCNTLSNSPASTGFTCGAPVTCNA